MKELPVYKGKVLVAHSLVDDDTFDSVSTKVWRLTPKGYVTRSESQEGVEYRLLLHRVVLGVSGKVQVDHIDRNKLNNQRSNLRVVNNSLNQHNRGLSKVNVSGSTCVHWDGQRNLWRARTQLDGKPVELGRHLKYEDAVAAVEDWKANLLRA